MPGDQGAVAFGALIKRCRELKRMSQSDLADVAGVSATTIQRLEGPNPPGPRRPTAIDLAIAVGTDIVGVSVDDALALLGYEPLALEEKPQPTSVSTTALLAEAERLLLQLSQNQLRAVVALLEAIIDPDGPPTPQEGRVVMMDLPAGSAARSRAARRRNKKS